MSLDVGDSLASSLFGIYAGRHEQHGGKGLAALMRSGTKIQHRARSGPVIVHQAGEDADLAIDRGFRPFVATKWHQREVFAEMGSNVRQEPS